ncbi:hypothetical protein FMEAI12_2840038 [Parafrankia sp. Ea1.12]|nr:hypothetical protein FMEAI12_2840038 [Parafrankia sp. Ea1.12]
MLTASPTHNSTGRSDSPTGEDLDGAVRLVSCWSEERRGGSPTSHVAHDARPAWPGCPAWRWMTVSQAGAVLVVRPDLTDVELNELFDASWPDRGRRPLRRQRAAKWRGPLTIVFRRGHPESTKNPESQHTTLPQHGWPTYHLFTVIG